MSLHKEPSFSVFNDLSSDGSASEGHAHGREGFERTVTIDRKIEREFSFEKNGNMGLIEEESEEERVSEQVLNGIGNLGFEGERDGSDSLCLAPGIAFGGLALDDLTLPPNLEEESDVEEHCKKMVEQCPFHPLFLRNYARILESKGELHSAEEHYSRASSADPGDGEIWMEYAKLVWKLHRDKDRASSYFKLATEIAPKDSAVLAAYASFLWEIEDGEEEKGVGQDHLQAEQEGAAEELDISSPKRDRSGIAEGIRGDGKPEDLEEYYRKIIDDNPNNALFLGNFAKFLYEIKGDLQRAEEYYSRAVLAGSDDGEVMARYAQLVWELHRDRHKAKVHFERALQVSPGNSNVQAAYALFLWENEDDEEDEPNEAERLCDPSSHEQGPAND